MSSSIHSIAPPGAASQNKKAPGFFERLANALVYVIAFPFIAAFLAIKNVFVQRKEPAHSYYKNLPEQHLLGQDGGSNGSAASGAHVGGSPGGEGPETPIATRTRSKKI